MHNKEYRSALVSADVRNWIAYQTRQLREDRGWSQEVLGERARTKQSAISRLEDPDYGKLTVSTLLSLASAFDVGLEVKFVSFSKFLEEYKNVSPDAMKVPSFSEDAELNAPSPYPLTEDVLGLLRINGGDTSAQSQVNFFAGIVAT